MTTGIDTTSEEQLVPAGDLRDLPAMVRHELFRLSLEQQEEFLERYRSRRKSRGWAWLLWFLGWHFAYFGQWGLQILYVLSFFGFLVWWIVEAFKVGDRVRQWNADRAVEALRDLKAIRQGS